MAQVLVRDVDDKVVERLKARAKQSGRSLQVELKTILEHAAGPDRADLIKAAARMRRKLAGRKHSDSTVLIAEDRKR